MLPQMIHIDAKASTRGFFDLLIDNILRVRVGRDVLFNNTVSFVFPTGAVRAIMSNIKAVGNYKRDGRLVCLI